MAIALFCYTSRPKGEVETALTLLSSRHPELFSKKFLLSEVREAKPVHQEIAGEYGLRAQAMFLVDVNDKSAAGQVADVADTLREALGQEQILVLWENERRI